MKNDFVTQGLWSHDADVAAPRAVLLHSAVDALAQGRASSSGRSDLELYKILIFTSIQIYASFIFYAYKGLRNVAKSASITVPDALTHLCLTHPPSPLHSSPTANTREVSSSTQLVWRQLPQHRPKLLLLLLPYGSVGRAGKTYSQP